MNNDEDQILDLALLNPMRQYLVNKQLHRRSPTGENPFRASNALECPRKLAYAWYYPELAEKPRYRMQAVFDLGDACHDLVREYMNKGGIEVLATEESHEVQIIPGVKLRPRLDNIVKLLGHRYVLDIKSMAARSFEDFERNGVGDKHAAQLNIYMLVTQIKRGVLLAINKNTSEIAARYVPFDKELLARVREGFKAVKQSTPDQLPQRAYAPKADVKVWKTKPDQNYARWALPWMCSYCSFVDQCWGHEDANDPHPVFSLRVEGGKPVWEAEMSPEESALRISLANAEKGWK